MQNTGLSTTYFSHDQQNQNIPHSSPTAGMSAYDDDYYDGAPRGRGPPPAPYPPSAVGGADQYDAEYGRNGGYPPVPQGSNVPPPPMGDQLHSRPSALKREGSRSRVPHLRPEFPDEASYLGSNAPDLESKNRRRHRDFRDKRDGYESDEGEAHRRSKQPARGPPPDDRDRRRRGPPLEDYDERGPPPPYDEKPPRRRRDRDRDMEYDEEPPRRDRDRDRDRRRRDNLDVEYGSDPIPVRRTRSERQPYRPKPPKRDDYEEDIFSSDEDDRRRPPPRRRGKSSDATDRRRRRDDYDDDRSDYSRRTDDRDRRRRDRSRHRYSDEDSEYDDRDRRRRKDKDRKRDESPPKELKIGGIDVGPMLGGAQKHVGTLLPLLGKSNLLFSPSHTLD